MIPQGTEGIRVSEVKEGMTLRDYFAGQALVGLCNRLENPFTLTTGMIANRSFEYADAMLSARKDSDDKEKS